MVEFLECRSNLAKGVNTIILPAFISSQQPKLAVLASLRHTASLKDCCPFVAKLKYTEQD